MRLQKSKRLRTARTDANLAPKYPARKLVSNRSACPVRFAPRAQCTRCGDRLTRQQSNDPARTNWVPLNVILALDAEGEAEARRTGSRPGGRVGRDRSLRRSLLPSCLLSSAP